MPEGKREGRSSSKISLERKRSTDVHGTGGEVGISRDRQFTLKG